MGRNKNKVHLGFRDAKPRSIGRFYTLALFHGNNIRISFSWADNFVARVFPRKKAGETARVTSKALVVTRDVLVPLFDMPLRQAAIFLGVSGTALKSICRKLEVNPLVEHERALNM